MIRSAIAALRDAQLGAIAATVVYRRAETEKSVSAVPGRTVFRSTSDSGIWLKTATWDFIIPTAELGLTPETGDEIEFDGSRYEVLAPYNEPVWRWSDPYRTAMRVHTKQIGGD